jgi:pyruvate dehydrogenase E2 component (dihydrolipoamide acetyltransferase)
MVPKIRNCESLGLLELSRRCTDIVAKARDGKLSVEELNDGTFTVTNLGMYGLDFFTAVINPPEAAILAVSAAKKQPIADGDIIRVALTANFCLSADHRILDGAMCAKFLTRVRDYLETPGLMSLRAGV